MSRALKTPDASSGCVQRVRSGRSAQQGVGSRPLVRWQGLWALTLLQTFLLSQSWGQPVCSAQTAIILTEGVFERAPGEGGVVGDVDVAGIGLGGGVEGVGCRAGERQVRQVCCLVDARWIAAVALPAHGNKISAQMLSSPAVLCYVVTWHS